MIHLKPLIHHGPTTHTTHKEGYLKWHYHPNTNNNDATQAIQTYQHITDHEPRFTTQWDNGQLYTFPEETLPPDRTKQQWETWAKHIHQNVQENIAYLDRIKNPAYKPQTLNNPLNNTNPQTNNRT